MTTKPAPRVTTSIQAPIGDGSDDTYVRQKGRALIIALYSALRALKLYPAGHATVQRSLDDLAAISREIVATEGDLELRVSGEFIFVNGTRLRLDLENYASFSHVLSVFRVCGIGQLHALETTTAKEWQIFLANAQTPSDEAPTERLYDILERMETAGVTSITLAEPPPDDGEDRERSKERAKKTYAQSVAVTKDLMASIRMGRSPNLKKIKRVVQGIVDQILNDEASLVGLTTIRDYDEYTFTHSVNVCIFSVALGKRLGLTKLQLYDLGMAALFHDIGKSRVPLEVLNKSSGLTDVEWRQIAAHPWLGVLALFQVRGSQEMPYRSAVVAMEHHMKIDLTGYPRAIRPRQLSIFSKIVSVADAFDAATSRRVYKTVPMNPAEVLRELRDQKRRGMDTVVVKAFINLTGIYPVGTLVVLDTFELGIVQAVNPLPEMLARPIVRIISDAVGNLTHPGNVVDLADRNEAGAFLRTIVKTEDPDRFGVRVGDYFV
ncbi:MAG TPA: HD domain-containing phosphohydrolase [Gemmatimonadaceae bacterium]|nr:HD domain-containing phosphohydrolase [Gemmatimonadaceae bacterium]